jgi:hypothetical protein
MPLADILVLYYLWTTFSDKTFLNQISSLAIQFNNLNQVDIFYLEEISAVILQGLKFFLALMGLYHLIIYISHYLNKDFARLYLFVYSVFAVLVFFLGGISSFFSKTWVWGSIFLGLSLFYAYQSKGLKNESILNQSPEQ